MNPIALALILLGLMLIALAGFLMRPRSRTTAILVALAGGALVALPFVVSMILMR
ncbi:MAG TPA: hypothetical protein VL334_26930 [Anaerolineae bacterium]|nr:hypothetical protein [Anaerolineae bacterium]